VLCPVIIDLNISVSGPGSKSSQEITRDYLEEIAIETAR
jgi:hypothetical protein